MTPFGLVPDDVRGRAEALTGRPLEDSYEGFTKMLLSAIHRSFGDDASRPARKRRR